jgi:hypothetical protein
LFLTRKRAAGATCRQRPVSRGYSSPRSSACSQFSAHGRQGYENWYAAPLPFWSAACLKNEENVMKIGMLFRFLFDPLLARKREKLAQVTNVLGQAKNLSTKNK